MCSIPLCFEVNLLSSVITEWLKPTLGLITFQLSLKVFPLGNTTILESHSSW